jgi:hypothetical protein
MQQKQFSLGSISYRMPNVIESMRILAKLGVKTDGSAINRSEFDIMADVIEQLKPFVTAIDAKKGDTSITEWDDALTYKEFLIPLTEIAGEVLAQFNDGGEKGKKRKKS